MWGKGGKEGREGGMEVGSDVERDGKHSHRVLNADFLKTGIKVLHDAHIDTAAQLTETS